MPPGTRPLFGHCTKCKTNSSKPSSSSTFQKPFNRQLRVVAGLGDLSVGGMVSGLRKRLWALVSYHWFEARRDSILRNRLNYDLAGDSAVRQYPCILGRP